MIISKLLYKLWKYLNKRTDVSKPVYKLHKHLSKKLIKKGIIPSYIPLQLEKKRTGLARKELSTELYRRLEEHFIKQVDRHIPTILSEMEKKNCEIVSSVSQKLDMIINLLLLKEVAPGIIEEFVPFKIEKIDDSFKDALYRSFFRWKDIDYLRDSIVKKLNHIICKSSLCAGGLPMSQVLDIYDKILEKDTPSFYSFFSEKCRLAFYAHLLDENLFKQIFVYVEKPVYQEIGQSCFYQKSDDKTAYITRFRKGFWLQFLSLSIYLKHYETAEKVLRDYIDVYGIDLIPYCLPVAAFSENLNISNDLIHKSAVIFNEIEKNAEDEYLRKLITSKRVAIVGNGPQQKGQKTGRDIDKSDVVIRFNQYSDAFPEDYGSKTDVWCLNPNWYSKEKNTDKINSFCIGADVYISILPQDPIFIEFVYNYIMTGKTVFSYTHDILRKIRSVNSYATSGFHFVYWVKSINKDFQKKDCYGFSFTEDDKESSAYGIAQISHVGASKAPITTIDGHSLLFERKLLNALFENENGD